jgi:hypothetical protein
MHFRLPEVTMSVLSSLAYRAVLGNAARSVLIGRPRSRLHPDRGRFTGREIDELLETVWRFERGVPARPDPEHGLRMRTTLRLAAFALAFVDALVLREVEREYAVELVADLSCKVARWSPFSPCPAVTACPVAAFLRSRHADDLCERVWCDAVISEGAGLTLCPDRVQRATRTEQRA